MTKAKIQTMLGDIEIQRINLDDYLQTGEGGTKPSFELRSNDVVTRHNIMV